MNPFFDIQKEKELTEDTFTLKNLGLQRPWIVEGRRRSEFWGTTGSQVKTTYRNTTDEDYDKQFIQKLVKLKPIYNIGLLIEHHYDFYLASNKHSQDDFLKHMRYIILPKLKKSQSEVCVQLFEEWLIRKETHLTDLNSSPITGNLNRTLHRIHFDDLSWSDFERLIFAYVKRLKIWKTIDLFGQAGHDEGQDIWGESNDETYCYLCANYRSLTLKKAKDDINKLVKANAIPNHLIVVCGGKVAARTNKDIKSYAKGVNITNVEVWSSVDIEENIRLHAPDVLQRFFEGNNFPEASAIKTG